MDRWYHSKKMDEFCNVYLLFKELPDQRSDIILLKISLYIKVNEGKEMSQ